MRTLSSNRTISDIVGKESEGSSCTEWSMVKFGWRDRPETSIVPSQIT